jgi:flagellar motor switch protein FliN/FliY
MTEPVASADWLALEFPAEVWLAAEPVTLGALLDLKPGEALSLTRSPDDPVDLVVNGVRVARGELVVVDGRFGLRITEAATQKLAKVGAAGGAEAQP